MPGGGQPIVVGGGIQLTGGAIDEFLVLTSITPPTATTSPRIRRVGTTIIMESAAGRENTVIGPATTGSATNNPEILIGKTITSVSAAVPSRCIGIGENIGFTAASQNNVLIGIMSAGLFPAGGTTGGSQTIVGRVVSVGGAFRNSVTAVGDNLTLGASNIVAIGASVNVSGANSVAIGDAATATAGDSVVIGTGAGAAGANSTIVGRASTGTGTTVNLVTLGASVAVPNLSNIVAIGNGVSVTGLAAGDILIGNNNLGGGGFSSRVVWGGADLHTNVTAVPAWTFRHKNAQGADTNAGDVTWIAPRATGNTVGASIIFQTTTPGASGAALQAVAEVARFNPGTATQPRNFQVSLDKGLWFTNQTSGAGAGAGTLTNAPTAGNPTHWLRVRINGTDMFIPCWP